jgi:ribosomal-protein-alanine N-acetyltransferase
MSDATAIARHANNRRVWIHLRDRFPHPYTMRDARTFLTSNIGCVPETTFAIDIDGEAVGGIGVAPMIDVERVSAEIGYWLGEAFWGRGIMTEAVRAITTHAIAQHHLTRIFALPFATNTASCRVLEKAGYTLEARLRRSAIKDGHIVDQCQYAFIVEA